MAVSKPENVTKASERLINFEVMVGPRRVYVEITAEAALDATSEALAEERDQGGMHKRAIEAVASDLDGRIRETIDKELQQPGAEDVGDAGLRIHLSTLNVPGLRPNEAIRRAKEIIAKELYPDEKLEDLRLEEVELNDEGNQWLITFGFFRRRQVEVKSLPSYAGFGLPAPEIEHRVYKRLKIGAFTGKFLGMEMIR